MKIHEKDYNITTEGQLHFREFTARIEKKYPELMWDVVVQFSILMDMLEEEFPTMTWIEEKHVEEAIQTILIGREIKFDQPKKKKKKKKFKKTKKVVKEVKDVHGQMLVDSLKAVFDRVVVNNIEEYNKYRDYFADNFEIFDMTPAELIESVKCISYLFDNYNTKFVEKPDVTVYSTEYDDKFAIMGDSSRFKLKESKITLGWKVFPTMVQVQELFDEKCHPFWSTEKIWVHWVTFKKEKGYKITYTIL